LFNSLTWCLTKTVKPKLETSIFWCLQGFFPNSLKKEAHYCSEQKGEGDTHPELPGKEEGEAEGWWKESFQAQSMRDYWSPLLSRVIQAKGSTGAWEPCTHHMCAHHTENKKEV
jgi:hypothetical protein